MADSVSLPKVLTLEELAIRYGPVELQKPLSKAEFTTLAERFPRRSWQDGFVGFLLFQLIAQGVEIVLGFGQYGFSKKYG